jgi:hypothetical protein
MLFHATVVFSTVVDDTADVNILMGESSLFVV